MTRLVRRWTSNRGAGKAPRLASGKRSRFEERVEAALIAAGVKPEYETIKIKYEVPSREATYTPDFKLPNGIIVEAKGVFDTEDRQKHILIKQQHPELDIRFCFQRTSSAIYKGSKTTYADWCAKHGFRYCEKVVPQSWIDEPPKATS